MKATLDLAVVHADGRVDVVDYKRSRGGDADRYAFQLAAYAAAARAEFAASEVRTGLIHLLGRAETPEWLEPEPADFAQIMQSLLEARFSGAFAALESRAACVAARCGFVQACHRR